MYAYPLEELAWAVAREREEEARRARPHTDGRPRLAEPLRSWLARWVAGAGRRPDRRANDPALGTAESGCC